MYGEIVSRPNLLEEIGIFEDADESPLKTGNSGVGILEDGWLIELVLL